jgi:hypothetical protein
LFTNCEKRERLVVKIYLIFLRNIFILQVFTEGLR